MRIVNRAEFLAMPAGTIFAKYEPCIFGELTIKGDTCRNQAGEAVDFLTQQLIPWFIGANDSGAYFNLLDSMASGASSPPLDFDTESRDGLFDNYQQFAIFETRDVLTLISRLIIALGDGYSL